jgi:hypothetical protein
MPGVERLGNDLPSRSTGTAEHKEFHVRRILAPPHPAPMHLAPLHPCTPAPYSVIIPPMTRPRLVALVFAAAVASSVHAQAPQYRARLSVVPIDVAMQSTIAGSGSATAILKGSTLTINGTFSGLKTAATVARVHRSPRTGMRGVPIGDLTATAETSGAISGSIELTKEQIDDLAAGRLYIQLHSQKAPDGNLWGWLLVPEGKK